MYRSPILYQSARTNMFTLEVRFWNGTASAYLCKSEEECKKVWRNNINKSNVIDAPIIRLSDDKVMCNLA